MKVLSSPRFKLFLLTSSQSQKVKHAGADHVSLEVPTEHPVEATGWQQVYKIADCGASLEESVECQKDNLMSGGKRTFMTTAGLELFQD